MFLAYIRRKPKTHSPMGKACPDRLRAQGRDGHARTSIATSWLGSSGVLLPAGHTGCEHECGRWAGKVQLFATPAGRLKACFPPELESTDCATPVPKVLS